MVDINDSTILTTGLSEKNDTAANVVNGNYMDDDMENLAYSDSESASIAMADDEFCDALDHLAPLETNTTSKENGKYIFFFLIYISNLFVGLPSSNICSFLVFHELYFVFGFRNR